ncbi:MAG: hypothetical protein U0401_11975 [Anaerolineae bacterium]
MIVLGFELGDIPKSGERKSQGAILIVDQCIDNPPANVHCAVFKEYGRLFAVGPYR